MTSSLPTGVRTVVLPLVLGGCAVLLAACGADQSGSSADSASAPSPVIASTSIWADVTSHVACDRLDVPALIPVGTDAHSFEPSVQDADTLRNADLVVVNGLDLEEGLQDSLRTAESDGATVLAVGPELSPLDAPEGGEDHADEHGDEHADEHGHEHGGTDPHVWMDPDRVALAVPLIADALQQVDGLPVSADELQGCATAYVDELHALSAEMDATLASVPTDQRKLVTNHESLGYFADRFDFQVIGAAIPSTSSLGESNPRALDELATTMRSEGVSAIFAETTAPTQLSKALAAQVGGDVQVVQLFTESLGGDGSGATTYVDMMRTDAGLIADALGGSDPTGSSGSSGQTGTTDPAN